MPIFPGSSTAPGARGSKLVVVDGDPLADIGLLAGQSAHMAAIMKGGRFFKDLL